MALNFLKKLFSKKEDKKPKIEEKAVKIEKQEIKKEEHITAEKQEINDNVVAPKQNLKESQTKENLPTAEIKTEEKKPAEKTDEELAKELMEISPELLSQAKTPEMRKVIINIYRRMLEDGVNPKDENQVKKWLKKHPEVAQGGEPAPKIETYRREKPKIGRNDPCPCGSGKKYKKCCGRAEK